MKISRIEDVVSSQMCCGCGACVYISPEDFRMVDTLDQGRRPVVLLPKEKGAQSEEAIKTCPGIELSRIIEADLSIVIQELLLEWGPVIEVWEGYASDEKLRHRASSGGVSGALALYGIEKVGMEGVLHTRAREETPWLNRTVFSKSYEDILAATGSRYSPASPCDGLKKIEEGLEPSVFIGKPCDVAGARKACMLRPGLNEKMGLTIAIFCAGTPATHGTIEMLRLMRVKDLSSVRSVRYRGMGWPGKSAASIEADGRTESRELSYEESWGGVLQKYRQWRCYLCPDHTGEFADVSVGDPWYRQPSSDEAGRSLVLVRTKRGQKIVRAALAAGYIHLTPVAPEILPRSQPGLKRVQNSLWGRLLTCRLMGVAQPEFKGMSLFQRWREGLGMKEKIRSFSGTANKIIQKKIFRKIRCKSLEEKELLDG